MRKGYYWNFQGTTINCKVAQQEITELTNLAQGLIEFERRYCNTHGEKQPVLRMLSMINRFIGENIDTIEQGFISGEIKYTEKRDDGIPI